jgi:Alpha/beta hydrolase of unknown function (DUF900)
MAVNAPLPAYAVINFAVRRNRDGTIRTYYESDVRRDVLRFHANMRPSNRAILLYDIVATRRCAGLATVYSAKFVDPSNNDAAAAAAAIGNVTAAPAPDPASSRAVGGAPRPKSAVFFLHGFNSNPTGVFKGWQKYQDQLPDGSSREVVPVLWADNQLSIFGYSLDKLCNVDPAGQALSDLVGIANGWAFPTRSLVCHSMGNFVLRRLARHVATTQGVNVRFDDIFMVAADVSDQVFDAAHNQVDPNRPASAEECDGISILALAAHQVHVLHSSNDWALKARVVPNCGGRALGARGYDDGSRLPNARGGNKLTQTDCSHLPRGGCLGHNYQFEGWAVATYERIMNDRGAAAAVEGAPPPAGGAPPPAAAAAAGAPPTAAAAAAASGAPPAAASEGGAPSPAAAPPPAAPTAAGTEQADDSRRTSGLRRRVAGRSGGF